MLTSCVGHLVLTLQFIEPTLYCRGTWKTSTFKIYNFEAEGIPTSGGALHPLLKVREEIRNIFLEMG
jgi:phenylalanyl-tRNA synthetase alpha subunit